MDFINRKMKINNKILFVMMLNSGAAFAQSAPLEVSGPSSNFPRLYEQNRVRYPLPTSVATTAGVDATLSGNANVRLPSGENLPVPVSSKASVSKAALKAAAKTGARLLPLVGTALMLSDLAKELKESGVIGPDTSCGQSVCKPVVINPGYRWREYENTSAVSTSASGACLAANGALTGAPLPEGNSPFAPYRQQFRCTNSSNIGTGYAVREDLICQANFVLTAGLCVYTGPPIPVAPFTDAELEQSLQQKMDAEFAFNKRMYDAMQRDAARDPLAIPVPDLMPDSTPLAVTAPPVTSPVKTTGTKQIPNADGSTSTETTTQQTTVSPVTSGTTVGNAKTSYPASTTTTTTNINNTTQVTNVTTSVSNTVAVPSAPLAEFPDDYNKEVTQQKILESLDAAGSPVLPDQTVLVSDAKSKNLTDMTTAIEAAKTAVADKSGWFSWVWTPPFGACTPMSSTYRGYAIGWNLCPSIAIITDIFGWLLALFSAITIYGQIFKGTE